MQDVSFFEVKVVKASLDNFGGSPSAEFIFVFSYVFNMSEKGIYKRKIQ